MKKLISLLLTLCICTMFTSSIAFGKEKCKILNENCKYIYNIPTDEIDKNLEKSLNEIIYVIKGYEVEQAAVYAKKIGSNQKELLYYVYPKSLYSLDLEAKRV